MGNLSILDLQNRIATGGFGIFGNINSSGAITGTSGTLSQLKTGPISGEGPGFFLFMDRQNIQNTRIHWYNNTTFKAWMDYMQNPAFTTNGVTPSTGEFVTQWARRFNIENDSGFGWIFESGTANSTSPTCVFEILHSGRWKSAGSGKVVGDIGFGVTGVRSLTGEIATITGNVASISGNNADALDYGNSSGTVQKTTTTGTYTTTSATFVNDSTNDTVSITLSQSGIVTVNFNCLMGESSTTNSMSGFAQLVRVGGSVLDTRSCPSFAAGSAPQSLSLYGQEALDAGTYSYRAEFRREVSAGSSNLLISWRQINASAMVRNG